MAKPKDAEPDTPPVEQIPEPPFDGACVVDDGTAHMGRAVPGGRVCSAHENRYHRDGSPRIGEVSAT
jgi:hypothetical protein